MTVLEDLGPRPRRGGGLQIQRYLDVRITPPHPPAPNDQPPRQHQRGESTSSGQGYPVMIVQVPGRDDQQVRR
jgi:hypothetical protein